MVFKKFIEIQQAYLSKRINSQEYIAADSLFNSISFRLPPILENDKLLFLKISKEVLLSFFGKIKIVNCTENASVAVLDNSFNYIETRLKYIKKLTNQDVKIVLSKSNLLGFTSIFNSINILFLVIKLLLKTSFVKQESISRLNYALIIKQLPEIINFLFIIKKNNIKTVFDFANFEVDSNFLYLLLKGNNIVVYKVPSPGPLFMHNKNLLTDYLVISSGYQEEEVYAFKETIFYSKLLKFYPETSPLTNLQKQEVSTENLKVLGFYSHASWLRAKQNHIDNGLNLLEAEENLLSMINKVFSGTDYKLLVFLHPKEKQDLNASKQYYSKFLKDINFEFLPVEKKSTDCFHLCNIALVTLSTILFERLFEGYKILICKKDIKGFPNEISVLNSINFSNEAELTELVSANIGASDKHFFEKNKLTGYTKEVFISNEYR
ncbi:MAG: hypothetical protein V4667_06500 [Bacteroidota bacterium]